MSLSTRFKPIKKLPYNMYKALTCIRKFAVVFHMFSSGQYLGKVDNYDNFLEMRICHSNHRFIADSGFRLMVKYFSC